MIPCTVVSIKVVWLYVSLCEKGDIGDISLGVSESIYLYISRHNGGYDTDKHLYFYPLRPSVGSSFLYIL